MPTDQAHLIGFIVAQGVIVLIGVGAYVYARMTAPKDEPEAVGVVLQHSLEFPATPPKAVPPKVRRPPMAGV